MEVVFALHQQNGRDSGAGRPCSPASAKVTQQTEESEMMAGKKLEHLGNLQPFIICLAEKTLSAYRSVFCFLAIKGTYPNLNRGGTACSSLMN